jgi:hypothetical protein
MLEGDWMLSRPRLLADLQRQLAALEFDLRSRTADPGVDGQLRSEWESARIASRTGASYVAWRDEKLAQIGAAWLLSTVFLRFCEDNGLIDAPYLAGPGERLAVAVERQQEFFQRNPHLTDRDWIEAGVKDMSNASPAVARLFDHTYNPMWQIAPSHQAAKDLLAFWRKQGAAEDRMVHDFTDPAWDTHFLGDLYQDVSEHEKSAYALVQTPEFVEEFILDHTLDRAIEEFGLEPDPPRAFPDLPHCLRVIDPVCGSGHFLLGAFRRLLEHWERQAPSMEPWDRISRVLAGLHGVDKNPFAASITRFRLIVAAMKAAGTKRLSDVPDLRVIVMAGDSLLYGRGASTAADDMSLFGSTELSRRLSEDIDEFVDAGLLDVGSYHAVFGNPPYIVPKDKAEAEAYRAAYPACTGTFALTIPFIVRFFGLAIRGNGDGAGYVGLLCSNSFMKRNFGRRLIEQFFPTVDLTHVIDTSGVFIPGHGTPTGILFGRDQEPQHASIKAILGLRGEPEVPREPALGYVWRSILSGIDHVTYEDNWTQVLSIDRSVLSHFPWNLADRTTTEILRQMKTGGRLGDRVARIGYVANTGSDDLFTAPPLSFRRVGAEAEPLIPVITGSGVRDWTAISNADGTLLSGAGQRSLDIRIFPRHWRRLWPYRTVLGNRSNYSGRSFFEDGRSWYEWHHVTNTPHTHPWLIVFPWVSTHSHFAVLRERSAPLNSAPVILLPETASDSDVLQLAALLNSSLICFWLKQYSNSKGQPRADQTGTGEPWTLFYEFTATTLNDLPLPRDRWSKDRWSVHAEQLDKLAQEVSGADPQSVLRPGTALTSAELDAARIRREKVHARLVSLQEELDWEIYGRYGLVAEADALTTDDPARVPDLRLGERAFEIVLARRMAAGDVETQWFARHRSTPITEIPAHWPQAYREVVQRRIDAIEHRRDIAMIERPEYKRRWQSEPWDKKESEALRAWLLARCEHRDLWFASSDMGADEPRPMTVNRLADRLREDADFVSVARLYAGPDADLAEVIAEIIDTEHVPYLAALRYKDTGMRKWQRWENTWRLQREEDTIGQRLDIPVPPRYTSADFRKSSYWANRGKLDVPNERFISFPLASPDGDGSLLLGWAGWDSRERAHALMTTIEDRTTREGWESQRIRPLVAGLAEVVPWVRQWHGEVNPVFGVGPADAYASYLEDQKRRHNWTNLDLAVWQPPSPKRGRPRKTLPLTSDRAHL